MTSEDQRRTAFVGRVRKDGKVPVQFIFANGVRIRKLIACPDLYKETAGKGYDVAPAREGGR